jgi:uncharacterized phage-associated protein
MATVHDVATYIEREHGAQSKVKLQKLVYYAQAWSLAWTGTPLFTNVIKAWILGPVSPELWNCDRSKTVGDPSRLTGEQVEIVRAVLDFYGPMSPTDIMELSHREAPWRDARKGLSPDEPGERLITHPAMRAYYGPLATPGRKRISEAVARGIRLLLATPDDEVDSLFEPDPVDGEAALTWLEGTGADPWQE